MTDNLPDYTPPKVWKWDKANGGRFANINRPIAGPTKEVELPVGKHPLQLYSMATLGSLVPLRKFAVNERFNFSLSKAVIDIILSLRHILSMQAGIIQ